MKISLASVTIPDMELVLDKLDIVEAKGMMPDYVLGGGVASSLWAEPIMTEDMDIFIVSNIPVSAVMQVPDFQQELIKQGGVWEGARIRIQGVLLDVVDITTPLMMEAFETSVSKNLERHIVRVILPEYLIAKYVEIQRPKDLRKIDNLLEYAPIDYKKLKDILQRYNLYTTYTELGLSSKKPKSPNYQKVLDASDKFEDKEKYRKVTASLPMKEKVGIINGLFAMSDQFKRWKKIISSPKDSPLDTERLDSIVNMGAKQIISYCLKSLSLDLDPLPQALRRKAVLLWLLDFGFFSLKATDKWDKIFENSAFTDAEIKYLGSNEGLSKLNTRFQKLLDLLEE